MSYFLKKSNYKKKGIYIQIYESFRDPATKQPRNKCIETLGYVCDLIEAGIEDPVSYYQAIVKEMNERQKLERSKKKDKYVGDSSPVKYLGYFPLERVLRRLEVKYDIEKFQLLEDFHFSIYDCLSSLIYARACSPLSKKKTAEDIIPRLYNAPKLSYDQILSCLEYLGENYEKFIEIFTFHTEQTYGLNTSCSFFDCTNFYFEIDREDDERRYGPSKENRHDPILSMGLLLDANCIPICMRLFPGNQSEKPVIRDIIYDMRKQNNIVGKTVQVADKGLNCAQNIIAALNGGDGYIFSKSVKQLSGVEQSWVLNDNNWQVVLNKDGEMRYAFKECIDIFEYSYVDKETRRKFTKKVKEKRVVTFNPKLARKKREEILKMAEKAENMTLYQNKKKIYGESSKFIDFLSVDQDGRLTGKKALAALSEEKIEKDIALAGFNLLVTSELHMPAKEIYETYHRLWRIEESFRALKSQLDARPVFLHRINRIKGHFLICYLTLLLERIVQFNMLESKFGTEEIYDLFRGFQIVQLNDHRYLNLYKKTPLIEYFFENFYLPVKNAYLSPSQIEKVLGR